MKEFKIKVLSNNNLLTVKQVQRDIPDFDIINMYEVYYKNTSNGEPEIIHFTEEEFEMLLGHLQWKRLEGFAHEWIPKHKFVN